jgi:hypothetical protein
VFGPELQEVQQEASERLAAAERKVGGCWQLILWLLSYQFCAMLWAAGCACLAA